MSLPPPPKNTELMEKMETKIKIAVLDIKLWIITSLVIFLVTFGGSIMCSVKKFGQLEEQIERNSKDIGIFDNKIQYLRNEDIRILMDKLETLKEQVWKLRGLE